MIDAVVLLITPPSPENSTTMHIRLVHQDRNLCLHWNILLTPSGEQNAIFLLFFIVNITKLFMKIIQLWYFFRFSWKLTNLYFTNFFLKFLLLLNIPGLQWTTPKGKVKSPDYSDSLNLVQWEITMKCCVVQCSVESEDWPYKKNNPLYSHFL